MMRGKRHFRLRVQRECGVCQDESESLQDLGWEGMGGREQMGDEERKDLA